MSATETKLHPAIAAVSAEEDEWRAIGFWEMGDVQGPTIRDVGRIAEIGYYYRELPGTSNPAYMEEVDLIEPAATNRAHALGLRNEFDIHWKKRPQIAEGLGRLWVAGFFGDTPEDAPLIGRRVVRVREYEGQDCTIIVEEDGAVTVRLDRDSIYADRAGQHDWHEYRMPRGTYLAEHEIQLTRGKRMIRPVINSESVTSQVELWIGRMLEAPSSKEAE